jgi:hypothetical protein
MRIFAEPCKELAEPVGSAEPRLKNTGLEVDKTDRWQFYVRTFEKRNCHLIIFKASTQTTRNRRKF